MSTFEHKIKKSQSSLSGVEVSNSELKHTLGLESGLIVMYVGNLETYQGIDLLLESFALLTPSPKSALNLVIVGGDPKDIQFYKRKASSLSISDYTHFLGQQPIEKLHYYLEQADILVSPRTLGNNTPMKIYSYLQSGKPVVATDLPTHTQVLKSDNSMLTSPSPKDFSRGILTLVNSEDLRTSLGQAGKALIDNHYSYPSFCKRLYGLFDELEDQISAYPRSWVLDLWMTFGKTWAMFKLGKKLVLRDRKTKRCETNWNVDQAAS